VVAARATFGGPAPSQVTQQLAAAHHRLTATRAWLEATAQTLPTLASVTAEVAE
jgi:hypothetical protein